ncbi:MAG: OsmC family peroxiredoxin [Actinobacteria bacterium]|nr:OsmC family peroxiredoxin [Actinomycetota bacterium]
MAAERRAEVSWQGDLMKGSGKIESVGSGAIAGLDVTWASRSEDKSQGKTSPEELLAAAHAACFSMALSHALGQAGTPPERLRVSARSTFVPGTGITEMALELRGTVPGLDDGAFREAAEQAKANCPVSKALEGNVQVSLDARLDSV